MSEIKKGELFVKDSGQGYLLNLIGQNSTKSENIMAPMIVSKYSIPVDTDTITLIENAKNVFYKDPNVIGIGIGNNRVSGEVNEDEIALIVYVKTKLPKDQVESKHLIPEEFEGMGTDVVPPFCTDAPKEALGFVEGHQHSNDMSSIDLTRIHEQWDSEKEDRTPTWQGRVQNKGDVCVIEDDGTLLKNINGKTAIDFVQAYKLFRTANQDEYEFVTFFTDSENGMPSQGGSSWYQPVYNEIKGIGLNNFDKRKFYDSDKLEGIMFINQGHFSKWRYVMLQEQGQRWASYARYRDSNSESIKNDHLLGGRAHWGLNFDNDTSPMDYDIYNLKASNGHFKRTAIKTEERTYCNLDLYLMGLLEKEKVGDFNLLTNVLPISGDLYSADKKTLNVENIILAEGERTPEASQSKKTFRNAFVVITGDMNKSLDLVDQVNHLRLEFEEDFYQATKKLGKVDTTLQISQSVSTVNFKNVGIPIPDGTGQREIKGFANFDSKVLSAGVALSGFKLECVDADAINNSIEIDAELTSITGNNVNFNIQCNCGDRNNDQAFRGHVTVLVMAQVK